MLYTRVGLQLKKVLIGFVVVSLSVLLLASNAGYWESVAVALSSDLGMCRAGALCSLHADSIAVLSRAAGAFATVGASLYLLRKTKIS